jgi:hypothetical protein
MANTDKSGLPVGLIRYALLVVSLPVQPTTADMCKLLMEMIPDFEKRQDGTAKISLQWKAEPMDAIDVPDLAIRYFGNEIIDANKFLYRILPVKLEKGEARCFVVIDAHPK